MGSPGHRGVPFQGIWAPEGVPAPAVDTPRSCPRGHRHLLPPARGGCRAPLGAKAGWIPRVGPDPSAPPSRLSPFHGRCRAVTPELPNPAVCQSPDTGGFSPPSKAGAQLEPPAPHGTCHQNGPILRAGTGPGSRSKAGLFRAGREPGQAQRWHCGVLWGTCGVHGMVGSPLPSPVWERVLCQWLVQCDEHVPEGRKGCGCFAGMRCGHRWVSGLAGWVLLRAHVPTKPELLSCPPMSCHKFHRPFSNPFPKSLLRSFHIHSPCRPSSSPLPVAPPHIFSPFFLPHSHLLTSPSQIPLPRPSPAPALPSAPFLFLLPPSSRPLGGAPPLLPPSSRPPGGARSLPFPSCPARPRRERGGPRWRRLWRRGAASS